LQLCKPVGLLTAHRRFGGAARPEQNQEPRQPCWVIALVVVRFFLRPARTICKLGVQAPDPVLHACFGLPPRCDTNSV